MGDVLELRTPNSELKTPSQGQRLGIVVKGSLTGGIEVKLDGANSIEDMAVGRYVTIEGEKRRFFGMITDVRLDAINPKITVTPPDLSDPFLREVLKGTSTYGTLHVVPMLTIDRSVGVIVDGPAPVKTVPTHFAVVREASEADVQTVFGREDNDHFYVGTPLEMETRVCLDLPRLVERSSGIFGKSGTGKTFLTRLLLSGMVQKSKAVNLIFDMHNEYGWQGTWEGGQGQAVKGLRQLFQTKVAVFTLDPASSRRRGVPVEQEVQIPYSSIELDDIDMLKEPLSLSPRARDAMEKLVRHYGAKEWLERFLNRDDSADLKALAEELELFEGTLRALELSLGRLRRLKFLKRGAAEDSVKHILACLDKGQHVVLEFGRYDDLTAYILVANVLTRRIHQQYVERTETHLGEGGQKPRPLVITIEEAHKFLSPQVAGQTIFGTIAREMRKYNVTLLVVDQRPSAIDDEVMSQLGTRITCLLDNERDIDAVLNGVPGKNELKAVLAKLETRQQALLMGHAVPMPVVIRTRDYGTVDSYRELGAVAESPGAIGARTPTPEATRKQLHRDLFGDD